MRKLTPTFTLLLAACGGPPQELASSESALYELPHRGEWVGVGQATFAFREGYEEAVLPEVTAEQPIETEAMDRILEGVELDEGDRAIIVDDSGRMMVRADQLRLALPDDAATSAFLDGEKLPDEIAADFDKEIFGGDDRTRWSNTTEYPIRAHAALRSSPTATRNFCSGAMIGPRHLLTAAHCFYKDGQFTKVRDQVRVVWGQNGSGNAEANTPLGKRSVVAWVFPQGYLNNESRYYDYALLILEDIDWSPGWLGFRSYGFTTLQFLNVNINGYPGHDNVCAASPRADGLCGGYLYHGYGTLELVFAGELWTHVDWQGGQSGSPVYRYVDGDRRVVGVVSGHSSLWNLANRMRDGEADALCNWIGDYPSSHFDHNCQ